MAGARLSLRGQFVERDREPERERDEVIVEAESSRLENGGSYGERS